MLRSNILGPTLLVASLCLGACTPEMAPVERSAAPAPGVEGAQKATLGSPSLPGVVRAG